MGVYYTLGPLSGTLAYFLYDTTYPTIVVIGLSVILYIILFFFGIYKKIREKLRVMSNLVAIVGIYIAYLLVQLNPEYNY